MNKKLKKILIIEPIIFFVILLILSIIMHPDLLISPLERLGLMNSQGNYIHPFLWTSIMYFIILITRVIINIISKLFEKKD